MAINQLMWVISYKTAWWEILIRLSSTLHPVVQTFVHFVINDQIFNKECKPYLAEQHQ